jgi:aminopeptidase YwaD
LKNRAFFFFCLFILTIMVAVACGEREMLPNQPPSIEGQKDEEGIEGYLARLCSERMEGREGGKKGEAEAALYLARFLQVNGVKPAGDEGTYFQSFRIEEYEPVLNESRMKMVLTDYTKKQTSENVLGLVEGKSAEIVILSAHYDHLGIIGTQCYPGANDNASGVAAVMAIVKKFAQERPAKTLLIAFWGSEEKGLLGSNYFCQHPTVSLEKVSAIINLDTVGNLKTDKALLGWRDRDSTYLQKLAAGLEDGGWIINWRKDERHNSDHWPFAKMGIPGFTLLSPDWLLNNHTPLDTPERVIVANLQDLADALGLILSAELE